MSDTAILDNQEEKQSFFKGEVLGHPAGLFVLFFTEMWERFSFYGMRVLLVNFLTMAIIGDNPGWGWSQENAFALFGTYAGLLYLTPIVGGIIADKVTGYRTAVIIGALLMTLGHASMAIETPLFLYVGLGLLVVGTGFFKPTMTSMISEMYKEMPEKKDGAYTIFYMGVNAGAFFGMMLCGYLAEKVGWSYGFGLAGIFMLLGMLQFMWAKKVFGDIGAKPHKEVVAEAISPDGRVIDAPEEQGDSKNPFTLVDKILTVICSILGLGYILNDPISKIGGVDLFPFTVSIGPLELPGGAFSVIIGLILFLFLVTSRIIRYNNVVMKRMFAIVLFALFTVIFWMSFEQGAGSLVIFARDFTQRTLDGSAAMIFKIVNALLTIIPLGFITYVLVKLFKQTGKLIPKSNIVLGLCFALMWGLGLWMIGREFGSSETEVTVSWFSILNSFFIIAFASTFSKIWESKYNPSAAYKYGFGLILLAVGFGFLAFGSNAIPQGTEAGAVRVSMIWLILAYLFHTLGELCLSPVGLSYLSKLVPPKMIAFMFGMWYLAIAIGNKLAAMLGGMAEAIQEEYSMSTFFLIFTIVPIAFGVIIIMLNKPLKYLMGGVK